MTDHKQLLFHNDFIKEFNKQILQGVLTKNNLVDTEIHIPKLKAADGSILEDFTGYEFFKNDVRYLYEGLDSEGVPININDVLPLKVSKSQRLMGKGYVYNLVRKGESAKIRPVKRLPFKEVVDMMSGFSHTNPTHYKLMAFVVLSQLLRRANFRVASPRGFGKTSSINILEGLGLSATTIANPSRAKLELLTSYNVLYVDEINNIKNTEWENIETFLLAAADGSNNLQKQTRAVAGVGEQMDISDLSIGFLYNDIDHYDDEKKYFDLRPNVALLDRFPPLRLYGELVEDWDKSLYLNVPEVVKGLLPSYRNFLESLEYYKTHFLEHTHGYVIDESLMEGYSSRWKGHLSKLFQVIDLYCSSQEEFDEWQKTVHNAVTDYLSMVDYPLYISEAKRKLTTEEFVKLKKSLKTVNLFQAKMTTLKEVLKSKGGSNVSGQFVIQDSNAGEWFR